MNKKKILISLVVTTALVVPFSVFAATSDTTAAKNIRSFFRIDTSKLNDQQKTDVKAYSQKATDLQKEFINKMVSNGSITKEQGDAQIKAIDDRISKGEQNGFLPGLGKEMGKGGPGRQGGFGFEKIDTSKLTDQQKTDLMTTYQKMIDLQKEHINTMVTDSLMTKEQGDKAISKIDSMISDIQKNGFTKGPGMFMGGFGGFGAGRIDKTNPTDQQKADLTAFSAKMADLQKEIINKLVADGAMTKDQGDAAVKRIDNMGKNSPEMMGKGRFGGHGRQQGGFEMNDGEAANQ
jgi:hypothetical protein